MPSNKVLIIGGGGFVGRHLCQKLLQDYEVAVADICLRSPLLHQDVGYFKVDMVLFDSILNCMTSFKPTVVICVASTGMSGAAMLDKRTRTTNIDGVNNIIKACMETGVSKFIYTSSYNVCFGGQPIENGDENTPYFPIEKHTDYYSSSKAEAEKIVLSSNGKKMSNGTLFRTSVIRPAAIYGEGEERHFPRIIRLMDLGLFNFTVGNAKVDWVHVDNLTEAYVKLTKKLVQVDSKSSPSGTVPCGMAYFISDGSPISSFEFFRPLTKARGVEFPMYHMSVSFMLKLAAFFEMIHLFCRSLHIHVEPFMTRAEVYKVGVTHYFSIEKAKHDLGYHPKFDSTEGGQRMFKYYRLHLNNENYFCIPDLYWWFLVFAGMALLGLFAFFDFDFAMLAQSQKIFTPLAFLQKLAFRIFKTRLYLQYTFYGAVITHILESINAAYMAMVTLKCHNTWYLWMIQTLFLGYPSQAYLIQRQYMMRNIKVEAK